MVLIWAGNYTVVKLVLKEIPPLPFNAVRLAVASVVFVVASTISHRIGPARGRAQGALSKAAAVVSVDTPLTARDWLWLTGLGLVGHFAYQLCFISGLARTTVANSALIIGCSPVVIALLSGLVGHERIARTHWAGALLSVGGLYLVAVTALAWTARRSRATC